MIIVISVMLQIADKGLKSYFIVSVSVLQDMAASESDTSSGEEVEDLDEIYDRVVNPENETADEYEKAETGDQGADIEDDSPKIRVNDDVIDNPWLEFDESDDIPTVKVLKAGGKVHFQTGTVVKNDGTIHGDIRSHSKYNLEFHCCDKNKKISIAISAAIIVGVVILVIILQSICWSNTILIFKIH